jgi:small subunit ribosomal protein S4
LARYTESVCRLCRREGMKLFLKGDRCFQGQVRHRDGATIRPGQHGRAAAASSSVRNPAPREAEGQTDLRPPRAPVPAHFARAERRKGHHGREPAARSSSAAWTTSSTRSGSPASRAAGAAARAPRPRDRERPKGLDPVLPGVERTRDRDQEKSRSNEQIKASVETARRARRSGLARPLARSFVGNGRRACRSGRTSSCPSRSS